MVSKSKKPAARLGDIASNHGPWPPTPVINGSPDVFINGRPAARQGDSVLMHAIPNNPPHAREIADGSKTVLFNGKPAARVSDSISCGGKMATGASNVLIGDSPTLLDIPDLEIPEVTFTHPRERYKVSQSPAPASASMAVSADDPVYYTPPPASPITGSQQSAVDYWQQQKDNADNFPAYLAAHLMKLNTETGYSIAEGLTATFEIVTDKDKFLDIMAALKDSIVDTVTDPVGAYNAVKKAATDFAELPLSEQGDALYKASLGVLAGGAGAKSAKALGEIASKMAKGKKKTSSKSSDLPKSPETMEEVLNRMDEATTKVQAVRASGAPLPASPYTLEDKLQVVENGLQEKYIVRIIESRHAKDSGTIGWVNPDNGSSNYWTTTYTQLEYADKDAELIAKAVGRDYDPGSQYTLLIIDAETAAQVGDITTFIPTYERLGSLAKTEMPDVDPELIDTVMTPEYSKTYEGLVAQAKIDNINLNNSDDLRAYTQSMGLSLDEVDLLEVRQEINMRYGANEQFLGNGLTRDVNSLDGTGPIETYSLDKNPGQLGQLEEQGVLKRIELTSY